MADSTSNMRRYAPLLKPQPVKEIERVTLGPSHACACNGYAAPSPPPTATPAAGSDRMDPIAQQLEGQLRKRGIPFTAVEFVHKGLEALSGAASLTTLRLPRKRRRLDKAIGL